MSDRHPYLDGWTVGFAGDANQSSQSGSDDVVAGSVLVRTVGTETGYRAINDPGIDVTNNAVVDPELLRRSRREVLE
jgi:hypothetical protein